MHSGDRKVEKVSKDLLKVLFFPAAAADSSGMFKGCVSVYKKV